MSIKNLISSFFTYTPNDNQTYNFNLAEDTNTKSYPDSDIGKKENTTGCFSSFSPKHIFRLILPV